MSLPGTKSASPQTPRPKSGCRENNPPKDVGRRKTQREVGGRDSYERAKCAGDLGMYPTPNAVAIASASRGFLRGVSGAAVASMVGVIRVVQIVVQRKDDGVPLAFTSVFFSEDRSDTTYFSLAQLPRSRFPQRSLQKGIRVTAESVSACKWDICALSRDSFLLCELCALRAPV